MNVIIGIDNGTTTGGMVAISVHNGSIIDTMAMPWHKYRSRKEVNLEDVCDWIDDVTGDNHHSVIIVIEEPNNSRNASTAYSVASCFHSFRGYFTGRLLNFHRITPQSWQKAMLGKVPKGETKQYAINAAKKRWADEEFTKSPRCKTPHAGIVDAALIAEYYRTTLL